MHKSWFDLTAKDFSDRWLLDTLKQKRKLLRHFGENLLILQSAILEIEHELNRRGVKHPVKVFRSRRVDGAMTPLMRKYVKQLRVKP